MLLREFQSSLEVRQRNKQNPTALLLSPDVMMSLAHQLPRNKTGGAFIPILLPCRDVLCQGTNRNYFYMQVFDVEFTIKQKYIMTIATLDRELRIQKKNIRASDT